MTRDRDHSKSGHQHPAEVDPYEQRLRHAARLIAKGAILYAKRMAREAEERKKAEEASELDRKESA